MLKPPPIDAFAESIRPFVLDSVRKATRHQTTGRLNALPQIFDDPNSARSSAAEIKDAVLDSLKEYLLQFESAAMARGTKVHWAATADSAVQVIRKIIADAAPDGCTVVKAKSMATEEIHLNDGLIAAGYEVVETDLGEFIVQLDGDRPSHIVAPIIHKNRQEVSETFARYELGPKTEVPSELAAQARKFLREKFFRAAVGISGVNFGIAETGRLVIVENEGNNRICTTSPRVHIALMGIEKLLPCEEDIPLFLHLLAGSATGQKMPVYVHMISGPRTELEADGPEEVHVVLLDNGRSNVLGSKYRKVLRCIRCGACQNVCPVFRQASGHAYRHVYGGPIGAVLAPAMFGISDYADLAQASTLCGACEEACPVQIPLPEMLLELRNDAERAGLKSAEIPWRWFGAATHEALLWKVGLNLLPLANRVKGGPLAGWTRARALPVREGRDFRRWWIERS